MELAFASGRVAVPAFWQPRFYDFNVWSEKKLKEKLHYMHRNPVDRKLVEHPQDWPWSSWSFYAKGEQGLIRINEPTQSSAKAAPLNPKGAAFALRFHDQSRRHPPRRDLLKGGSANHQYSFKAN